MGGRPFCAGGHLRPWVNGALPAALLAAQYQLARKAWESLSRAHTAIERARAVGKMTMLLVEGGRLDEVTINGDKAEVKVLKEGLPGITAVTLAGNTAYVAEARLNLRNDATKDPGPFRAIGVPYKAPK